MIKRTLSILLSLSLICVSGCYNADSARNVNSTVTVNDILRSGMNENNDSETDISIISSIPDAAESTDSDDPEPSMAESAEGVDVDLTIQSSTVVYSMVYDMMSMPEKYLRKTVKMTGIATSSTESNGEKVYHACVIKDATACCAQGIEYVLTDEEFYPEDGETITVVGEFSTYNEGMFRYSTLLNAELIM